jgi:hypothetical protein
MPTGPIEKVLQDEVAIYMMETEYERFMTDWSNYIDLLYMVKNNPIIAHEFHKLLMLVNLHK